MTEMDCKTCRTLLPDLLMEAAANLPAGTAEHLAACPDCRAEVEELRATWLLLDTWEAPEPSAYFDARVRAHLRDAQSAAPEGMWERLAATFHFSTGRGMRSAVAGLFAFLLLLGGGTMATFFGHHTPAPAVSSPAVNDLKIYDNNAQALQQMDLLDDPGPDTSSAQPQT